ncbi:MAG: hypothetical protein H6876_03900 [Hyphomicrobiaceae bacterium]|nr:hypothetical protein [Hyphomicrobiaceae bacterium]MCC0007250.1 hypothetical protein [Hyphomicrobiaceae bacterium]
MMRLLVKTPYQRRMRKTRRGIIIASVLTVAALVLIIVALLNGAPVDPDLTPVAVESPIGTR